MNKDDNNVFFAYATADDKNIFFGNTEDNPSNNNSDDDDAHDFNSLFLLFTLHVVSLLYEIIYN